jgi:enoyl-CoA hydratase
VPSMSDNDGTVEANVVDDHILHISVDRRAKKNAFTPGLLAALAEALTRLDDEGDLWVGVLSFAGDHTTAGLDLTRFFGESPVPPTGSDDASSVDPFGLGRKLTKPLVTAIQGITYTVGIELALAGDIVVAADDTRLCQMEAKRGLAPLGGATFRYVERSGWGNAMYHLLRVDEFDAAEAHRVGLVQEVVPAGQQVDRAVAIAREIAANAPLALVQTKHNARIAADEGEDAAVRALPAMQAELAGSADFAEGIQSFVERRPAVFTGR